MIWVISVKTSGCLFGRDGDTKNNRRNMTTGLGGAFGRSNKTAARMIPRKMTETPKGQR